MEGNPKTLLEAMSCGLACIGSNIPGINQIITHKKNGYLCNLDSKSIANAVVSVYNNKSLMTSIARIPWRGSNPNSNAPKGAATTLRPPLSIWLIPWIRVKCSTGTINDVDALIAFPWNEPAKERTNISK